MNGQGWASIDLDVNLVTPLANEIRNALAPEFDTELWRTERNQGGCACRMHGSRCQRLVTLPWLRPYLMPFKFCMGEDRMPFRH